MKSLGALCALAIARVIPTRFIVVTVPLEAKVVAYRLGKLEDQLQKIPSATDVQVLISGLVSPIGVAYSAKATALFVADQGSQTIYKYPISVSSTTLQVGVAEKLLLHVDTRWLAVHDDILYFTDETGNRIMKLLPGAQIAEAVYSIADSAAQVSSPGGIFSDAYYLYWTNKNQGTSNGVIIKGLEVPPSVQKAKSVAKLSSNVNKAYGVCGSDSALYYTDESGTIFGVRKDGTSLTEVNAKLAKPRGCAFSEGTVFVADQTGIYSFAGNRNPLRPVRNLHLVKSILGATGITVVSASVRLYLPWILALAF